MKQEAFIQEVDRVAGIIEQASHEVDTCSPEGAVLADLMTGAAQEFRMSKIFYFEADAFASRAKVLRDMLLIYQGAFSSEDEEEFNRILGRIKVNKAVRAYFKGTRSSLNVSWSAGSEKKTRFHEGWSFPRSKKASA